MATRRRFLQDSLLGSSAMMLSGFSLLKPVFELPNVLIIGDSISIGYTPSVREVLSGKANVTRPYNDKGRAENCQGTTYGVENIDRWIGDTKWAVIHFNFGLHDLKHVKPGTMANSNDPNDPLQADLEQYKINLTQIVEKLKATGAKLIFATTTPYPDTANKPLRDPGMSKKYNQVAKKVMRKNSIGINDLYSFVLPQMNEIQRPDNVHFTDEGSTALAKQVAQAILNTME